MILFVGLTFIALLGLAFGSFLNVCLSRWPAGESIVTPRSHCRGCGRTLHWWENVPVLSWIALRGRCRTCNQPIGLRYVLVEAAVAAAWACIWWRVLLLASSGTVSFSGLYLLERLETMFLCFVLIGLAALDAEHLWLPDIVTISGIFAGLLVHVAHAAITHHSPAQVLLESTLAAAAGAAIIALIRWSYWLARRAEGIGWGDAKLMAMLGAWLGLSEMILSLAIGVILGAITALALLAVSGSKNWSATKLPLGTFLSIGGIVSSLWGYRIVHAYLHWAGF